MTTEDEQVLQDIENIPPVDLNSTQISEPVDDLVPSLTDTGETNSFPDINPNHLASSSNVDTLSKPDTPSVTNSSKPKKTGPGKNKRISEIKVNLIQELIEKIESANENASRSEVKENFRIQRSTFGELVRLVGPHVFKNDTNYRAAIPVEKRIACVLYALGSSSELRTISHLFGIGVNTTGLIVHEFCNTIIDLFLYKLIKFPTTDAEICETMNGFLTKFGYPLCLGSLDGTHIHIKPPIGAEPDYYNYKKFHSVIMLATVNSNLMFTYINDYLIENNVKIYAHLIADSAFPLHSTLIKPYVERCIHRKMEYELDNSVRIIKAIAILHNICIIAGDDSELDWDIPHVIYKKLSCNSQTTDGNDIRQALTDYFIKNPL
ncbi:unnamed protein product [Rotaria sordida]|uniref:DDE Tnp4 domain-containing protein n=1 Tax=Rotaria sordida TaxID=392033 RepID=A0A814D2V4_9BILA|nr:unnamed protein product [Rotaria sordida]CAF3974253.1 unnamed protein product [Rotaria sordida]